MPPLYKSNRTRRMAGPMSEGATPPAPAANPPEAISAFIPKDFFGDMMPKEGDSITVMVKAVDPETGEVEVTKGESNEPPMEQDDKSPLEKMDDMPSGEME